MIKFKAILTALILALTLILAAACGESTDNPGQDGSGAANPDNGWDNLTDETEEPGEERILPDIPDDADFGGHIFSILTFGVAGSHEWENIDLTSEEQTGDIIGDAVYLRNRAVEAKYNFTLKQEHRYDGDFGSTLRNAISSGTDEFDLISPRVIDSAGLMQQGYFMNLHNPDIEYIDLDKPWWDQSGIREMSIDNKLFIILSDTLLSDDNATCIIVFNKEINRDNNLADPYQLVREGKWTVDALYEMAKASARDLNGDGAMTPADDLYGYITWGDAMITFLHAGGERLVSKNENDLPVLAFNTPQTFAVMEKAMDLMYDDTVTGNIQKSEFGAWSDIPFEDLFRSGRAAFGWVRLGWVPLLRAMEADFGILPIPKIFESDDNIYYSTINVHTSCALAIPVTSRDLDRTSIIMEALAAESRYTLVPAYYEVSLRTQHTRDDESSEMLDIILSNRVLDIGDVYNFADFGIEFYRLSLTNNRNLASFYDRFETRVERELERLIGRFEEMD
ncbi:MAG: hypothetical protein FWH24_00160 [Oscillospiraceae bacterium]|nr:hypothetical protein [Oscillospiraceae bacterium]